MNKWFTKRMALHTIACLVTLSVVTGAYILGAHVFPGIISYIATVFPLFVVGITAVARVNDIKEDKVSKRWQIRRAGLSIVAAASFVALLGPISGLAPWPTWDAVAFYWGVALTWLTTPSMPPWWRYISGRDEVPAGD